MRDRWRVVAGLVVLLSSLFGVILWWGASTDTAERELLNGRAFIQDNLWSAEGEQYAVWVDPEGTPWLGRRARGGDDWETVDLSTVAGNELAAPTADDLHNVYAVAVDGGGHVHVMGNMHVDDLRYIRTMRPGVVDEWVPGRIAGPAEAVTYPQLVALPDSTLLFFRRAGGSGDGDTLLDVLEPGATRWRHVGVVISGRATRESAYLHRIAVGPDGTIHLLVVWRDTPDPDTNNDLGYARSSDGGRSWETSGGAAIPLPITHENAEIVLDTDDRGSGLVNNGGLVVDGAGDPHGAVVVADGPEREILHVRHDGDDWRIRSLDGDLIDGRPSIAVDRSGGPLLLGADDGRVVVVDLSTAEPTVRRTDLTVPPGWEVVYDGQALARFGAIETLVPDGAVPEVFELG